jgi:hypothetical protein
MRFEKLLVLVGGGPLRVVGILYPLSESVIPIVLYPFSNFTSFVIFGYEISSLFEMVEVDG